MIAVARLTEVGPGAAARARHGVAMNPLTACGGQSSDEIVELVGKTCDYYVACETKVCLETGALARVVRQSQGNTPRIGKIGEWRNEERSNCI